jgi:AcrR family transcriptional regulator
MKTARSYTMRARADAAAATRQRVLDATVELLRSRLRSDIRLDDIAAGAGVTVQTVLRLYGRRADLIDLALERTLGEIADELDRAEPGDVAASVSAWFDHYERVGDVVVRNVADEHDPAAAALVRIGRARHRRRVQRQFGPQLARLSELRRRLVTDALVCACDVQTWKLLRRDMGRSRRQAEATMRATVEALLEVDA